MKRFINLLFLVLIAVAVNGQAKYVFYFIGDGMGVNQVNGTEMYLADKNENRIGVEPLLFTQFPVASMATTFAATNSITDSSAAGTALSTGVKTYNAAIGVGPNKERLETVAEKAKKAGRRVGVTTSVSVDHATPSAFYAHQFERDWYYEIATDLPKANFDFYAGGGFLKPDTDKDGKKAPSVFPMFDEAGYVIAKGYNDFKAKSATAKKMILIQEDGKSPSALPYAIDRKADDLTLSQITESAINFLSKDAKKGFFLMVEGGKIDWACHSNDAATVFNEVVDFNEAVKIAYEFYKKHPKETLIVVTADHETGGLGLGARGYTLNLKALANQSLSQDELSNALSSLRKAKNNRVAWEDVKTLLGEKMGFWTKLPLTWAQERMLRDEFEVSFVQNKAVYEESLYSRTEPLAARAKEVINQIALIGWTTGGHSAGYVPVYAIGAGSELFQGKMDNIDIPKRIAKAGRY